MKRPLSYASPATRSRTTTPSDVDSALLDELKTHNDFDPNLSEHRAIRRLAAESFPLDPSRNFAREWKDTDHVELLRICNRHSWDKNFVHIFMLFDMAAVTSEFNSPSVGMIADLLGRCPKANNMILDEFCADDENIGVLKDALSKTSHLCHFHIIPEDLSGGAGRAIVQGLRSHHRLMSWRHWTDDDPDAFVPELTQTLSHMPQLQSLDLCIAASWKSHHFESLARQLMRMPALQNLKLWVLMDSDLSLFFAAPSGAGEAWPLARLTVSISSAVDNTKTANALVKGISTLRRMTSLQLPRRVYDAMPHDELVGAIQAHGAFCDLVVVDAYGDDEPAPMHKDVAAALATNRNRFLLAKMGTLDAACSAFVNIVLATQSRRPVSDIGIVLATHLVGHADAPDLRDCQGLLRTAKPIWTAARDARRAALLELLSQPTRSVDEARDQLQLAKLGRKYGILPVEGVL